MRLALSGMASGLLLFLCFPKPDLSLAAWVALVPLLHELSRCDPRRGLVAGAVTGLTAHVGLVYWTSDVMVLYGGLSRPVSVGVLLALVGYLALFLTLFGGLTALACRWGGPQALLVTPILWVGCELARNAPWGGFPWCLLGYSQVKVLPVLQIASLTGIYGVSLLVVWVNAVIAYVLTGPPLRWALSASASAVALLGVVLGYGYWALAQPLPEATYPVAAVQGSVLQENKWDPGYAARIYGDHIRLSSRAVGQGARLIVWPESSTPFRFDTTPALADHMRGFARSHRVYLLFGSDDYEVIGQGPTARYRAFNGAKLITPEGDVTLRYHKIVLVPFGEYVPMKRLFFFAEKLTEGVSDFSPGTKILLGQVDSARVGVFICYEAIYPGLVRRFVKRGAGLLVNLTNDAWFGRSSAPYQHLRMAIARAVETRRYLVRAANTGISAIVDPYGRVLARSDLFVQEVVTGKVSFRQEETLFVRYGNLVGRASFVVTALFALWAAIVHRPRGGGDRSS